MFTVEEELTTAFAKTIEGAYAYGVKEAFASVELKLLDILCDLQDSEENTDDIEKVMSSIRYEFEILKKDKLDDSVCVIFEDVL